MEYLGKIYQFRALPFGISMASWLFTRVVNIANSHLHRSGMDRKRWWYYEGHREYHRQGSGNQFVKKTFGPTGYLENYGISIKEKVVNVIVIFVLRIAYSQIYDIYVVLHLFLNKR